VSEVRIDAPALTAEADAIAQEYAQANPAPPPPPALDAQGAVIETPAPPSPQDVLLGYRVICTALIDRGASTLTPAWMWKPEKKTRLADACAQAALLWWPDCIIPPKYMALFVVAGVAMEVIEDNRNPETGKLRPLVQDARKDPQRAAA
jgi:hypothetical protein